MSFLYPLGLLGLIGIPVLIIIYIIKNKYTEQVISSTYLWTLSERFLKKRLPINKLVGLISLILQILAVLFISLAIAHPVFYITGAANDYCFVLDGSGSMNIVQEGSTRLDVAKGEIRNVINDSQKGSAYSLVVVGSSTDVVFRNVTDKNSAIALLDNVSQSYTADVYREALGVAQGIFDDNPSTLTYLLTDKEVVQSENVTVINVSDKAENYAVSDIEYTVSGGKVTFSGSVISYESNASLTLSLFLDGAEEQTAVQVVEAVGGEAAQFTFEVQADSFMSAKISIAEEDALALDNEVIVFNVDYENSYNVLIVSDSAFFIQAALVSIGTAKTWVIPTLQYTGQEEGYDLFIFHSYTPRELPENAAVWFFNPVSSVAKTGFTVQDQKTFEEGVQFEYNTQSSATLVKTLLQGVEVTDKISLIQYQQCGLYRNFTTLLSHAGNPLVFAGSNEYGNREVVFAFDLQDSNMSIHMNFDVLMKNLLEYTFPTVLESTSGYCGDTLRVNVVANCDSIRIISPISGRITYLDTASAVGEYELTEAGTYSIVVTMKDSTSRNFNFYASIPEEERSPAAQVVESFSLLGEASNERRNGIYDDLLIFFIILAVFFLADWMVYCYEQYQLR